MEKWHYVKKSSEPARRKTHWDFVLEEMCWLAKDFFQVSTLSRSISLYADTCMNFRRVLFDLKSTHLVVMSELLLCH